MHRPKILILALLVLGALQGPLGWINDPTPANELIVGPDSYMRLQRVLDVHEQGHWYERVQSHTNAPYGEQLHWTRPMDSLLYAGAWVGSLFTDFPTALLYWGLIVSPLLLGVTLFVWSWGTRFALDDIGFLLSVAMLVLLPQFNTAFKLGRPDHHSLLMLLFVAQIAVFIRVSGDKVEPRHLAIGGVLAALALWVSLESLSHLVMFGGALGVFWIWQGGKHLRHIAVYLVAMALAMPVALLMERAPSDLLTVQYDRLSIVHIVLLATGAATWFAIHRLNDRAAFSDTVKGRLRAAAMGVLIPAVVMGVLFPKFFYGPFVDIASEEFKAWVGVIAEYHAIVPVDRFTTGMFFAHIGPALVSAGYICWRWKRAERQERQLLILLALGLVLFLPAALKAIRWSMYVQAIIWLPWTLAVVTLTRTPWRLRIKQMRFPAGAVIAPLILLAPVSLGLAILPDNEAEAAGEGCDWTAMHKHLEATRTSADEAEIVFSHYFQGSEMVWRTGYRAVGAPYGNNRSLSDTNAAFRAKTDDVARAVIQRRGIDLILTCPVGPEAKLYRRPDHETFYARMGDRKVPVWLKKVALPEHLASAFRLYRVTR